MGYNFNSYHNCFNYSILEMKFLKSKKIIIYFMIFGFIFGVINSLDKKYSLTGGDTPLSLILNQPGTIASQLFYQQLSNLKFPKASRFEDGQPFPPKPSPLKIGQEGATPSASNRYRVLKEDARDNWLTGQYGLITWLNYNDGKVFPLISAFAWGMIGTIIYFALKLRWKS